MKEKSRLIMEAALALFAEGGYHATSIQEIVDKCGMAKGSFYNYFKSKDELLLFIFTHFYESIQGELSSVESDDSLGERAKFAKQLSVQIKRMLENTGFIKMLMKEHMHHITEELDQFLLMIQKGNFLWLQKKMKSLYPQLKEEYIPDCAIMIDGVFKSYMSLSLMDEKAEYDSGRLPEFLLNRLDSIVEGLKDEKGSLLKDIAFPNAADTEDTLALLREAVNEAIELVISSGDSHSPSKKKELETLQAIKNELEQTSPNSIILESLLLMAEKINLKDPSLLTLKKRLKGYLF
ncbi:TetR/AcrR family transcriptional regulator [Peribacillus sp. B-H-3]|uniref:TetR/AcrR family transcriptional regulator n=1 Tax=Peribacillus sp. B-H-3 TaxID=3400420 RepID=UPI003B02B6EB